MDTISKPLITVFTPSYNRANTIIRTYQSLEKQSFKDFEWIVVDDGSTDNTSELFNTLSLRASFPIRYIRKENGGKHTAHNMALCFAKGYLFFTVDSDDWLTKDSLELISRKKDILLNDERLAGLLSLKEYPSGQVIGKRFPKENFVSSIIDLENRGYAGERSVIIKTNVLKKYPFPIVKGETFMTEGIIYNRIDCKYKFLATNETLTTCEYQYDGLSSNARRTMAKNPGGFIIFFRERIDQSGSIRRKIKDILRYHAFRYMYLNNNIKPYRGKHILLVKMLTPGGKILADKLYKVNA